MSKLRAGDILGEAFSVTFKNLDSVARAAFIPFAFGVAMSILLVGFRAQVDLTKGFSGLSALYLVGTLINFALIIPFLTKWHRFVLLGPQKGAVPIGWAWEKREWAYTGYTLIVGAISLGPVILLQISGGAAQPNMGTALMVLGSVIVILWFSLRVCFVYPAAAIGRQTSLGMAFGQTAGNTGAMFAAYFVVFALVFVIFLIVSAIYAAVGKIVFLALMTNLVIEALNLLIFAVIVAITATAYAKATDFDPNAQGT